MPAYEGSDALSPHRATSRGVQSQNTRSGVKGVVMSGATDAELLHALEADPNAFAVFYDRYESAVVAYFVRRRKQRWEPRSDPRQATT
jgi:hypothetical protein